MVGLRGLGASANLALPAALLMIVNVAFREMVESGAQPVGMYALSSMLTFGNAMLPFVNAPGAAVRGGGPPVRGI